MYFENIAKNNISSVLDPTDIVTTTTKTKSVNLKGTRSAELILDVGTVTGGNGSNYCTPILEESDDLVDANYTAVAAADIVGGVLPGTVITAGVRQFGYLGTKQYIRLRLAFTGSAISAFKVAVLAHVQYSEITPHATAVVTQAT